MTARILLTTPFLLLAACQATVPPTAETATKTFAYACDDGRTMQATYPDTETAQLIIDGQTHRLHTAISASGARYIGDNWQWWTKGSEQAWIAPLKQGETYASASAVECHGTGG